MYIPSAVFITMQASLRSEADRKHKNEERKVEKEELSLNLGLS
jgi:hypothetical protein